MPVSGDEMVNVNKKDNKKRKEKKKKKKKKKETGDKYERISSKKTESSQVMIFRTTNGISE